MIPYGDTTLYRRHKERPQIIVMNATETPNSQPAVALIPVWSLHTLVIISKCY